VLTTVALPLFLGSNENIANVIKNGNCRIFISCLHVVKLGSPFFGFAGEYVGFLL
jgi:hypothetical protein